MWECCNCVNLNTPETSYCVACGHNKCSTCEEISIPSKLSGNEKVYYFYLNKFYFNDKVLSPIERAKLADISKQYGISEKSVKKMHELSSIPYTEIVETKEPEIIEKPESKPKPEKKKPPKPPKKVKSAKPTRPPKTKTPGKSKSRSFILVIIIFMLIGAGGAYYFSFYHYSPKNLKAQLSGFKKKINSVSVSNDGNYIAANSYDKIIIYNAVNGRIIKTLKTKSFSLGISAKGNYVVKISPAEMYSVKTGKLLLKYHGVKMYSQVTGKLLGEHQNIKRAFKVKLSHNSFFVHFISTAKNVDVKIYKLHSGGFYANRQFKGYYLGYSSNGKFLATYFNGYINIWNVLQGKIVKTVRVLKPKAKKLTLKLKGNTLRILEISNDLKYILNSNGNAVQLININNGKIIKKFMRYPVSFLNAKISDACFSKTSNSVIVAQGNKIYLYRIN